jgi:hypothetical protein
MREDNVIIVLSWFSAKWTFSVNVKTADGPGIPAPKPKFLRCVEALK